MNNPTPVSPRDAEHRAIEEKAAEWFGRFEIGLNPQEERAFVQWLEADPRHGEALRGMDETWERLDQLKENSRLRAAPIPGRRSRLVWIAPPLLAAAAVALIFHAPGVSWRSQAPRAYAVTEAGGMKKIELTDGSIIHLNADSNVIVRFSRTERLLELPQGEAHFEVAKDTSRPFIVHAGGVAIKAIGTAFNVRHGTQGVEVFVTEGKVRLDDAGKGESLLPHPAAADPAVPSTRAASTDTEILVAGQRALVPAASPTESSAPVEAPVAHVSTIAPAEIQQALAWQTRLLEFDQMPLGRVVEEFNRFNSHQLVIEDAQLAQKPFGGSFRSDSYALFVQLLEERFGVGGAERGKDKTILRR